MVRAEEVLRVPESKLQCGQKEGGCCQKGDPCPALGPMPGKVCVEVAALSESQQGNQQFSSTAPLHLIHSLLGA